MPFDILVQHQRHPAGRNWIDRYWSMREQKRIHVLQPSPRLPSWLRQPADYSVWERNNRWLLQSPLSPRRASVTLIALWNGERGDGPGGTADMVAEARAAGASVRVLNTDTIFGLRQ
jgi:hypothetical protein